MLISMIGWTEVAVILVVVILILGPAKLPLLGESLGKMLRGFRKEIKALDQEKAEEQARKQAQEKLKPISLEEDKSPHQD